MARVQFKAVPKVKYPGTRAAMIAVATSQVGLREGDNNEQPFGRWYGMPNVAWCAIFMSWAAAVAGCKSIIPKHAWTPSGAQWFRDRSRWGHKPVPGAIAYFYSAGMGRIHHVALVIRVYPNGDFLTVEGNTNNTGSAQGNGVYKLRRRGVGGPNGGFGYPKYKPAPKKPKVYVVDISALWAVVRETKRYPSPVAEALEARGYASTEAGAAKFQRSLGYRGQDADGLLGKDSLENLGFKAV